MIGHIVFLKVRESDSKEQLIAELRDKLLSLSEHIPYIQHLEVGVNFKDSPAAMDLALITHFDNKEDLSAYANDPYHKKILEFIAAYCPERKVVDYLF